MKDFRDFIIIFIAITIPMVVALGIASALFGNIGNVPSGRNLGFDFNALDSITHGSTTVSATATDATVVLAANPARQYAVITDTDANVTHCVNGATSTLSTGEVQGRLLTASGGTYTIDGSNLWRGAVSCYSVGGTSVVSTIESP